MQILFPVPANCLSLAAVGETTLGPGPRLEGGATFARTRTNVEREKRTEGPRRKGKL